MEYKIFWQKEVDIDAGAIKDIAFEFRKKYPNLFMVLGAANGEKGDNRCNGR